MNLHDSEAASALQQRMRDALRLAQTRMQNMEENLKRLRSLQNKLYLHQQLNNELDINSKRLFVLNKEYASMSDEADEMDRFETFESVMAPFLKMQMLEQDAEESRRNGNDLEQEIRRTADEIEILRKNLMHSRDVIKTADAHHRDVCHTVEECSRLDGEAAVIEDNVKRLTQLLALEEDRLDSIRSMLEGQRAIGKDYELSLESLNARRHTMESHENMLERADLILMMLQRLEELAGNLNGKQREHQAPICLLSLHNNSVVCGVILNVCQLLRKLYITFIDNRGNGNAVYICRFVGYKYSERTCSYCRNDYNDNKNY